MNNNGITGRSGGSGSTFGLILIAFGGLLLLSNLGIIGGMGGIVGLVILGGIGAWLLQQYYTGRRQMWLLFAGFAMLGAAAATVTGTYGGAWFLGLTGLGFLTAWREDDRRWWALIPAGTLLTLAGVVVAEQSARWLDGGIVFFAGMAATFLMIYSLPRYSQSWALFPAAASAGIALLIWGTSGSWLLPLLLIGAGLYMVRGNGNGISFGTDSGAGRDSHGTPAQDPAPPAAEPSQAPRQLPDRITGAGPDVPDGWADGPTDNS